MIVATNIFKSFLKVFEVLKEQNANIKGGYK